MHERAEECNIAHNASQNKERLKKTLDKVSKTREETAQIDEAVMRTRSEISEVEKSIGETEKKVAETGRRIKKHEMRHPGGRPARDTRANREDSTSDRREDHCEEVVRHAKYELEHAKESFVHANDAASLLQGDAKASALRILVQAEKRIDLAEKFLDQAVLERDRCREAEKQMRLAREAHK